MTNEKLMISAALALFEKYFDNPVITSGRDGKRELDYSETSHDGVWNRTVDSAALRELGEACFILARALEGE